MSIIAILQHGAHNFNFNGLTIEVKEVEEIPLKIENYNTYYHGYWISDKFFNSIIDIIKTEITFPKIKDKQNKKYAALIEKSINPIAIHIRRGDMAQLGWCCNPEHFQNSIFFSENIWHPDQYFLFSDDLKWCTTHADELGLNNIKKRLFIVDANSGENAYRDMQLMTMCRHRISDHSTFSLMAFLLCPYANKHDINNWK